MSSLVEYDQNPLAEPEVGSPNMDGPAEGMQTNLLAIAWQARWLLMLTVLVGIGAAWVLLQRAEPRYTSMSRLYIERSLPKILTADTQFADSTSYLYTQAELLRSTPVLAAVVDDPANRSLETFRDPERADNPVGFLFKELQIEVGQNDDIIMSRSNCRVPRRPPGLSMLWLMPTSVSTPKNAGKIPSRC